MALILTLHLFVGAALSGSAVIAALVLCYTALMPILLAAGIGLIAGFPVSYLIARQLEGQ